MYSFEKTLLPLNHQKYNRGLEEKGIKKVECQPGNKDYRCRGNKNLIQRKVKP